MTKKDLIRQGLEIAKSRMYHGDQVWSRFSNDKVDIGEILAQVIRVLHKALPIKRPLRALSVGSSAEPQFRVLETSFQGGVYLLDREKEALDIVRERVTRQSTRHVFTILGDYNQLFADSNQVRFFLRGQLHAKPVDLLTFHHSLYYSPRIDWEDLFGKVSLLLSRKSAIHAVMMAAQCGRERTTTWLYERFTGRFFHHLNDQDLILFSRKLRKHPLFKSMKIETVTRRVRFRVEDFKKMMSVVWMILLYPNVHPYSADQRKEITEFIYTEFWVKQKPLIQIQDHMMIYKGIHL